MMGEGESWRERVSALGRREIAGLVVVGVLVCGAVGVWYVRSLPRPIRVVAEERPAPASTAPPADPASAVAPGSVPASSVPVAASPSPAEILVYVTGLVRHPGVYRFQQGDRVVDAIEAAGGAEEGADLTSLNLAALLTDGEQVTVGRAGGGPGPPSGTTSGSTGGTGAGGAGAGGASAPGAPGALVNLNTATLEQLESLPGIGPALGQRIIDYREQHGAFHAVDDLLNVSGIGDKTLEDLRPLVTV
jgi:competence protein ComEA